MTNFSIRPCLFTLLLLMGGAAPVAFAFEPTLAPSAAVACLMFTPGESDAIEYPPDLLMRKEGGTVSVEFTFSGPTEEPRVKVLNKSASDGLIDVVKKHVSRFRVPCMGVHDAPVTLSQDYVFDPYSHGKTMFSAPEDSADVERRKLLVCLKHTVPGSSPNYPRDLLTRGQEGRLVIEMHFVAPDKAPEIKWLAVSHTQLKHAVAEYVAGLRLPCWHDGPIDMVQDYVFKIDGGSGERTLIKDMTLRTLVSVSRSIPRPAFFDFNNMACPFELQILYNQPYMKNSVREAEPTNPARKPFFDWLTQVRLNLSKEDSLGIMGETFVLSVPCGKLDI